jgi:hypothetical protein
MAAFEAAPSGRAWRPPGPRALALHDRGAESPKETWLRLIVVGAGYPAPQTQIPVRCPSGAMYYLDLGWPDLLLALEYDGAHHRTDPAQFARDIVRLEDLAGAGLARHPRRRRHPPRRGPRPPGPRLAVAHPALRSLHSPRRRSQHRLDGQP